LESATFCLGTASFHYIPLLNLINHPHATLFHPASLDYLKFLHKRDN
jgi:hypothetical protein